MKCPTIYSPLGIAGALFIPALAIAAVEIPYTFQARDAVSATEMNENFAVLAEEVDRLEALVTTQLKSLVADELAPLAARVEVLESRQVGAAEEFSDLAGEATETLFQAQSDGFVIAAPYGNGWAGVSTLIYVGEEREGTLDVWCGSADKDCGRKGQGNNGTSATVLVPAGFYFKIVNNGLDEAKVRLYWQPLDATDAEQPIFLASNG